MKKILLFSTIMFMTIFSFSQTNNIFGQWKLTSVKDTINNKIDTTFQNSGNLSVFFVDNNNYTIFLSENTCYGTYKTENGLTISSGTCTKICCDDDKSIKFYRMLLDANKYKIKNENLLIYSKILELTFSKK